MRLTALAFLSLLIAACVPAPAPLAAQPEPPELVAFFTGNTSGQGTYRQWLSGPKPLQVTSQGGMVGDNFQLDQQIRIEGKAPRKRQWIMRPDGKGGWTASLTDATGPVEMVRQGHALRIRYEMKNGVKVEQSLRQFDERTIYNRMRFTRFGLTLARIEERIVKD